MSANAGTQTKGVTWGNKFGSPLVTYPPTSGPTFPQLATTGVTHHPSAYNRSRINVSKRTKMGNLTNAMELMSLNNPYGSSSKGGKRKMKKSTRKHKKLSRKHKKYSRKH
jgi:hypothetical protein